MSNPAGPEMGREDIEMLLPWFVTGKLDDADREKVEAYLAEHPEMRMQCDLVESEREEVTVNNEAMGAPSADTLARLMGEIEGTTLAHRTGLSTVSGWLQRGLEWLGDRSALVPIAATAAVLLVIQAGTIAALLWHTPATGPGKFQTASAHNDVVEQKGTFVLVVFMPTATLQQIEQSLQPLGITIADGPKPGGFYKLRLSDKTLSDAEREMLTTAMKSNAGVIKLVVPSP